MTIFKKTQELIGKARKNYLELFTTSCLFLGLPLVFYLYFDYRASLAIFVAAGIVVGLLAMRKAS